MTVKTLMMGVMVGASAVGLTIHRLPPPVDNSPEVVVAKAVAPHVSKPHSRRHKIASARRSRGHGYQSRELQESMLPQKTARPVGKITLLSLPQPEVQ